MHDHSLRDRAVGAFVGAVVGDALGWPQEQNSKNVDKAAPAPSDRAMFRPWIRRSGTRFTAYEEEIGAGEYSDDSQLLLSVARSRLSGSEWIRTLTSRELPLWPAYERGGGAALKRAAKSWQVGRPPWVRTSSKATSKSVSAYFKAGSNGGAMRVLPHCITTPKGPFETTARDVIADTICTHGHPRAILGSLAHAFATSYALKSEGTLGYGELLRQTVAAVENWRFVQVEDVLPSDFALTFQRTEGVDLAEVWAETCVELADLLTLSIAALDEGSAVDVDDVLAKLGCFDRKVNGSGVVSAVAANFLASRFAADPLAGLVHAAYLDHADTDTLASMVGTLMGAIHGASWLGVLADDVQDAGLVREMAVRLISADRGGASAGHVTKKTIDRLWDRLDHAQRDSAVTLPDGRDALVADRRLYATRNANAAPRTIVLRADDGQTLFFTSTSRLPGQSLRADQPPLSSSWSESARVERAEGPPQGAGGGVGNRAFGRVAVQIPVASLRESRRFYLDLLGIDPVKESENRLTLRDGIALVQVAPPVAGAGVARFAIEVASASVVLDDLERNGIKVGDRAEKNSRFWFRCVDPDGNQVEVWDLPLQDDS